MQKVEEWKYEETRKKDRETGGMNARAMDMFARGTHKR